MKTAIIYTRHIEYREYEKTIQEQIQSGLDFAKNNGLQVSQIYVDCFADKQTTYPMFEQLKKDCKKKNRNFDSIIIYSSGLLGRNLRKTQSWIINTRKQGIDVIDVSIETCEDKTMKFLYSLANELGDLYENKSSNIC